MMLRKTNKLGLIFALSSLVFIVLGSKRVFNTTPYEFPELKHFPPMPLSVDNPVTVEGALLGRLLFYDPILSKDSTFSCGSCHRQEAAFSDAPKRVSKGIKGVFLKRNTLPLFNLAWYPALFWDGKAGSVEEQVFHPVRAFDEMNLDWPQATERIQQNDNYRRMFGETFGEVTIDSTLIAKAIAQFERTLISNNSKYDKVLRGEVYFTAEEYEGFVLMNDQTKGDCLHCHTTDADALGTTARFSNNGLDAIFNSEDYLDKGKGGTTGKTMDIGLFKIPSLRNIAVTAPYMHDGRFETLEEVLDFYSEGVNKSFNVDSKMGFVHQGGVRLIEEEKEKIILFLKTLTDSTFLTNPAFSDPYKQ